MVLNIPDIRRGYQRRFTILRTSTFQKVLLISLLVLWSASHAGSVSAGIGVWTSIGPEGGYINALAIDPATPDTLYAGIYRGGVFKSTNGGGSWEAANTGLPSNTDVRALAIDPATPATLYAGTNGGGVFKSTNGGGSWEAANTGLTNNVVLALAIDPATPDTLYAWTSYGGGVFKSTDGGGSWQAANTGLPSLPGLSNLNVDALAINPASPSTLYAGIGGAGVFKSTNGGGSWFAFNAGLTNSFVYTLAIDPATPVTLYAGTSGGGVFAIQQEDLGYQISLPLIPHDQ